MTTPGNQGFTLVEGLVAIAVSTIVAAIAVPNAAALLEQYQLNAAANEVSFEIARAKMQAVAQNRFVRVVVAADGRSICRQTASSQSGPWSPSSCADAKGYVKLPSTVLVSGTGPTFDRSGLALASGQMTVSNAAGAKKVNYSLLGRVTMSSAAL